MTLETELHDVLVAVGLTGRQRPAVAKRFGWDGSTPATLKEAGVTSGYTRERVRQLVARTTERIAHLRPTLPITRTALELIANAAPAPRPEVAALLADCGLAEQPFDVAGILHAARLTGLDVDIIVQPHSVLRRDDAVLAPIAVRVARRLAAQEGATTPAAIGEMLGVQTGHVRRLLALDTRVIWLDAAADWLVVDPQTGRVATALRRMLALAGPPDPAAVQRALSTSLPVEVLAALLMHTRPAKLSLTERAVVAAIRAEGGIARARRIAELAATSGITQGTTLVCLSRSPLFRAVDRGHWAIAV